MASIIRVSLAAAVIGVLQGVDAPMSVTQRAVQADTVRVAPPVGIRDADRASILAALERVQPGGTVQFAPGIYIVGPLIRVDVQRVTLLGHPNGTTLRGCVREEYVDEEFVGPECNGLELAAGHQTVRNLNFEYAWHAIVVGCCYPRTREAALAGEGVQRVQPGGHVIEGNAFRHVQNGLRVLGESIEPIVIRRNHFVNVYHAIGINGRAVHFLNNDIMATPPHEASIWTHPGSAINVTPFREDHTSCVGNIVAGNRIEGHPHGIMVWSVFPQASCRRNIVRDNTIVFRQARFLVASRAVRRDSEADSFVVGVPLTLTGAIRDTVVGGVEENVVEGNVLIGAEGLAIELYHASRNRILKNSISGVRPRTPYPGNTLDPHNPPSWSTVNGSGIWVSPGSNANEITDNTFTDVAAYAVVLEGDHNRVDVRAPGDSVRDTGTGNRVIRRN